MLGRTGKGEKEKRKIVWLEPEEIRPNPAQPRRWFSQEELRSLEESIRQNGLLQPITVRRGREGWELVAGERRLRASRAAGMERIPCLLCECSEKESAVLAMTENLQRQDLNPFEEAEGMARLLAQWNVTQEEAAARFGKSQSYVANKLRLLRFSEEERKKILESGLTERHARVLLRLETAEERKEALSVFMERDMTVAQAEEYMSALLREREEEEKRRQESLFAGPDAPPSSGKTPRRTVLIRDVRIFLNTIRHAVDTMRGSGIQAESLQDETEEYIEYRIRIPKTDGKIQKSRVLSALPAEGKGEAGNSSPEQMNFSAAVSDTRRKTPVRAG